MDALTAMKQALEALEIACNYALECDPEYPFHTGEIALTNLRAAIAEMNDWQLVPKTPTQAMLAAGLIGESRYARMLDAVPPAPTISE